MGVLRSLASVAGCFACADAVAIRRQQHAETLALADAKNRPVSKVISLLKGMLKQLEKEGEDDEEIYDKLACWCETNDKEKTQSIAAGEERIDQLTVTIAETAALSAQLNTEIKNLDKEVSENQEALDEAVALRKKQLAEFNAEEKDLLQSISALKSAVTVLSKHQGGGAALLQASEAHVVSRSLHRAFEKHAQWAPGALTESQRQVALSLLQAGDYFDAEPTFKQSYAPQSGEIFGVLSQMKDTFEKNLKQSQLEERDNQKAFEDVKAAKEEQIRRGQEQIDAKTQTLANTDEKNAHSKEDLKDTRETLSADEQFLSMLKEKCQMTDGEWEQRQKTRQQEMEAVSQALEVLAGDEAHDLFTRTYNPALLQVESRSATRSERMAAAQVLAGAAQRFHAPFLAALAARVKLDAFARVKKAIDDMIVELGKENAAEIKHKDFCVDEFHENKVETESKDREKTDVIAEIEELSMEIKTLTESIDSLKAEVAEDQVQLKRAGEDREKESQQFQTTVADQRATQKLLQAALLRLQDFYGKKGGAFMQEPAAGPPPPAGFEEYKKNAAAGGVTQLIQDIINDTKAMEAEVVRSEDDAQKAYEAFVQETNNAVEKKGKEIVNKSEEKAKAEVSMQEAQKDKEAVLLELEQLGNSKTELHQSCDFLTKNFAVRQQARAEEVEALRQARAILSGAGLQRHDE